MISEVHVARNTQGRGV